MKRMEQLKRGASAARPAEHPRMRARSKPEAQETLKPKCADNPVSRSADKKKGVKVAPKVIPPGRQQSIAYRKALQKGLAGKQSLAGVSAGARVRMAEPEASTREVAKKVRQARCEKGKTCEPVRPQSHHALRLQQKGPQKVEVSRTASGQTVTGRMPGLDPDVTGVEAGACRVVTGTEYLGSEQVAQVCNTQPVPGPEKVTTSRTFKGMTISGTAPIDVQRVTGAEVGVCRSITGTEYLPLDTLEQSCATAPQAAKITTDGMRSGTSSQTIARSSRTPQAPSVKKSVQKVVESKTAADVPVTGADVSRVQPVTGIEPGLCKRVTGTGYMGAEEVQAFCGTKPEPGKAPVEETHTLRERRVTGDRAGEAFGITGAEAGACKVVTGDQYMAAEQYKACGEPVAEETKRRLEEGVAKPITGYAPGITGLTGSEKGACKNVTGTPYEGIDEFSAACAVPTAAQPGQSDFPILMNQAAAAPAAAPAPAMERSAANVETATAPRSRRITGDGWDGNDRVTGTTGAWAASRNPSIRGGQMSAPASAINYRQEAEVPPSPITGAAGNSEEGPKVTLSGGARA
ncbi:Carboxysome shell peptide mid-region [Sulfurivirga caldicuralii]|uniref:Carboxysome shell peptide mid-region n=1 Tax=Sulfurivirga caldicuralii TaxID=364032 RepID=A0A1N6DJW2_9GAMM|nr:CsoS2 family carboxysome shell protein [Sulfurivirga caldicuralii]SIN71119.1 Carboxysome shell peptide mid-region [Sulfurivirga caldicuralii]